MTNSINQEIKNTVRQFDDLFQDLLGKVSDRDLLNRKAIARYLLACIQDLVESIYEAPVKKAEFDTAEIKENIAIINSPFFFNLANSISKQNNSLNESSEALLYAEVLARKAYLELRMIDLIMSREELLYKESVWKSEKRPIWESDKKDLKQIEEALATMHKTLTENKQVS